MAKKGGKKSAATDVTNASAADTKDVDDQKKVEDSDDYFKQEKTTDTTTDDTKGSAVKTAAGAVDDDEEKKIDTTPARGIKRQNSRNLMQKDAQDDTDKKLFRPEFGKDGTKGQEKIWAMMDSYIGSDQRSIQRSIVNHVEYTLARTRFNFDDFGAYQAASYSVRDRLIEAWNDTQQYHTVSESQISSQYLSL